MTKKLTASEKKNRKPASKACVFCHSKHLQCSNERPCKNCVKRGLGDQCQDVVRKRAKYLKSDSSNSTPTPGGMIKSELSPPIHSPNNSYIARNLPPIQSGTMLDTTNDVVNKLLYADPVPDSISMNDSTPNSVNTPSGHPPHLSNMFNSNYLNQEYLMLGDIILHSKPTSPSPSNTSNSEYATNNTVSPNNIIHISNHPSQQPPRTHSHHSRNRENSLKDSRPFISLGFTSDNNAVMDNFVINNEIMNQQSQLHQLQQHQNQHQPQQQQPAINSDYVSPLISHHLYQTVQDIYSNNIINFDYPNSYHSLTKFLKNRFSGNQLADFEKTNKRKNLLIILKLIASYRPTFISAHKSLLKPFDLQFLEMSFQRSLIDYENLSQLNSSPTIIWRRTGEIVSISNDLISLLGFNLGDILSKRTFIMELMYDDESIINYFKLFKSVAVGNLHLSIKTKCKLVKNVKAENSNSNTNEMLNQDFIEFCSVWTVKRDLFDIPMLVVGQFLPILPPGEGVRMY